MRSATTRFGIRVQSGTALGSHVAGMTAGTWSELATTGAADAFTSNTSFGGSTPTLTAFANGGRCWHNTRRQIYWIGGAHDSGPSEFIMYDDDTNTWSVPAQPFWIPYANSQDHSYSYCNIDHVNDRFWYRSGFGSDGGYYDIALGTWTQFAELPTPVGRAHDGFAFLEHRNEYYGVEDGESWLLNPQTLTWGSKLTTAIPFYGMQSPMVAYNATSQVMVVGGAFGNQYDNSIWRFNSDMSSVQLNDAPFQYFGSNGVNTSYCVEHPTNGNFIVIPSSQTVYEFDAINDTWTPISSISGIVTANHNQYAIFGCPTYGTIILMEWISTTNCKMWVYKI